MIECDPPPPSAGLAWAGGDLAAGRPGGFAGPPRVGAVGEVGDVGSGTTAVSPARADARAEVAPMIWVAASPSAARGPSLRPAAGPRGRGGTGVIGRARPSRMSCSSASIAAASRGRKRRVGVGGPDDEVVDGVVHTGHSRGRGRDPAVDVLVGDRHRRLAGVRHRAGQQFEQHDARRRRRPSVDRPSRVRPARARSTRRCPSSGRSGWMRRRCRTPGPARSRPP